MPKLSRYAVIGFCSSLVSDTFSNAARVIKTSKQTAESTNVTYRQVVRDIVTEGGVRELFQRGLRTKIMINGIQGIVFTVIFKCIENMLSPP